MSLTERQNEALLGRLRRARAAKLQGDWGFEDAEYPRKDWAYDVVSNGTQRGYFDWVIAQLEADWEECK